MMMPLLGDRRWEGSIFTGRWIASGARPVTAPATGQVLGKIGVGTPDLVAEAITTAREAQLGWSRASFAERAAVLRRAAHLLTDHRDEIEAWLVRECGSTWAKATAEVDGTKAELLEASCLPSQPYGRLIPTDVPGRWSMTRRIPVGVVGVITPWNYPLLLAARSVAPALALGNSVVLKPAPNAAVSGGVVIARILEDSNLPPGVLQMLPGAADVGEALACHPAIGMISFTGSAAVGRRVGELAGQRLKKAVLELGGNNAFIVLDDADVEAASSAGAWGSFLHQGQICMSIGRHLVHERLADAYSAALVERADALEVGDPSVRPDVALGPLISAAQVTRVRRIVDDSVAAGARVLAGGQHSGCLYWPTVLGDVRPSMPAFDEETFGPVAPVTVFRDEEEAVELANRSAYGLVAAVYTPSVGRALELGERLRAGMVHINDQTVNAEPHVPRGGFGASGNGARFGGEANWDAFTDWQWITVREDGRQFAR